jgi:nucleotide-binding universal stress UspA family protein
MSWAKLIAVVDGGPGSEAVVRTALQLGETFRARVELLHVETVAGDAIPVVAEGLTAGAVEQIVGHLEEEIEASRQAAEALYRIHCVEAGLPVCAPDDPAEPGVFRVAFRCERGREADEVARRGRLADLVLLAGTSLSEDGSFAPAIEAAIFETGRPLLMVPGTPPEALGRVVAVAWDGTMEAARAVNAALPLLARAEKVFVLTADMKKADAKPSEIAGYLAEHGVAAQTWAFMPGDGPLGEVLLAEAGEAGADTLVMGAYGHSRLREMVLGGVTRSVTAKATIPVLMAH